MISAIDVGPVAAPGIEPSTRIAISAGPLHANAVSSGAEREAGEAEQVDAPVAPDVAELAEQRHRQREPEERPGHHPGQRRLARPELVGDVLQRHRHDRDREAAREQPGEHGDQHPPRVVVALADPMADPGPEEHRPGDDRDLFAARRVGDERSGRGRASGRTRASSRSGERSDADERARARARAGTSAEPERPSGGRQECSETASERDGISIATHQAGSSHGRGVRSRPGRGRSGRPYPCPGRDIPGRVVPPLAGLRIAPPPR